MPPLSHTYIDTDGKEKLYPASQDDDIHTHTNTQTGKQERKLKKRKKKKEYQPTDPHSCDTKARR